MNVRFDHDSPVNAFAKKIRRRLGISPSDGSGGPKAAQAKPADLEADVAEAEDAHDQPSHAVGGSATDLDAPYYTLYGETKTEYNRGRLNDSTACG